MIKNNPDKEKQLLDKHILDTFTFKGTSTCYKIEGGIVFLHYIRGPRTSDFYPDGFKPLDEHSYEKIFSYLKNGFIFSKPIATNLKNDLLESQFRNTSNDNLEIESFKSAITKYNVENLKKLRCVCIPKKAHLRDYQDIFEYNCAEKLSGREIYTVLNNIRLKEYYFETVGKAFKKAFSYFDKMLSGAENSDISYEAQKNIQLIILSKKEKFIKNFIEINSSFFKKAPNRVWLSNMLSELDPELNSKALLQEEENVELFEVDTWKRITVEVSKYGLYKNYPLSPTVSSYNAQNAYKSALSQFSTFIASNDEKLNWGLNIEQAHLGMKKNGNYLFSLTHSTKVPNKEKFQKLLKEFLEHIKPILRDEKDNFKITKAVSEIFDNKVKLKQLINSVVLYNDMSDNLSQNDPLKRKNKI